MAKSSDASRLPIARVLRLNAICEDCGRRFSMDRHAVAREQIRRGLTTPEALGSSLLCLLCVRRGGGGRNVSIVVDYAAEHPRPPEAKASTKGSKPCWSRAAVFGDDRTSPFPNLPPSRFLRD